MNIYVCTYMYIITISGKTEAMIEGEQKSIYGRVWKEEGKGRNIIIILSTEK